MEDGRSVSAQCLTMSAAGRQLRISSSFQFLVIFIFLLQRLLFLSFSVELHGFVRRLFYMLVRFSLSL